ncbi:OmpA family protein [Bailinhaonella thermotolerans]|nr:OmpA family protein [Bailinhaonella thermotolerans]
MIRKALSISSAALALAACASAPSTEGRLKAQGDPGARAGAPAGAPAPPAGKGYAREGLTGLPAEPYRVEVQTVERQGGHTLLTMEIVLLLTENTSGQAAFGDGLSGTDFSRFALLDPVAKKAYSPLLEKEGGAAYGTRRDYWIHPGVRYQVQVYFPALPAGTGRITVLAPGSLGEYAGIPVTEGTPRPVPTATSTRGSDAPPPGSVVRWPVTPPSGTPWSQVADLHELVEHPQKSTVNEGSTETVALRTDVLFAFDKAELSPKAAAVLDEVAAETRLRADPAKPPVIIEGHTDGKGGDSYNLPLSVRRAEAVRAHLERRLGSEYTYKTAGKGAAEPIAPNTVEGKDNPEGRARNRRVEISYRIRDHKPGATVSPGPSAGAGQGSARASAFRRDDGQVVGSLRRKTCCTELRLDVRPFYRDGSYLVGVYDVVNVGGGDHNVVYTPFADIAHHWSDRAAFGRLTVVDPRTKSRYYSVRTGKERHVEGELLFLPRGKTNRIFVYYPAPPDAVTALTLDGGELGRVGNVPIR